MKNNNMLMFCFLVGLAACAHAAHPLLTDDTGTQDSGNHQLELNTDWLRAGDGSSHAGAITYTVGLRPNLDGFVNVPASLSAPRGFGDVSLGFKWRWLDAGAASLALKPELLLPTGAQQRGLGNGLASGALTMIGSLETAPWALHGNLAASYNRYDLPADRVANRSLQWRVSAAAVYSLDPKLRVVFDAGVLRNPDKSGDANPAYVLTGFIFSPNKDMDFDAGVRHGLGCGGCAAQVQRQAGVGVTLRY